MASRHGLTCKKTSESVPLKHIDVKVTLCNTIGRVTSKLLYANESTVAVEALFSFPIDDTSAVFQCDAEIDDRYIVGECQPKDQAKDTYTAAMKSGHSTFLMEEHNNTGDMFLMSLGNLPPGKSATVIFSYVLELPIDQEGAVEFKLPTLLNPRYNPGPSKGGYTGPDPVSYCHASTVPYTLDFHTTINSQMEVGDVASSHNIQWTRDETGKVQVCLKEGYNFKSDLSLRVLYRDVHRPSLMVAKGNSEKDGILKHDIVMLSYFPKFHTGATSNKAEFIFVVDRSGSMAGSRMEHAKATLLLFLKSLPVGCYFNVISFGSEFDVFFAESKAYGKVSLEQAIKLQESMDANMGGTELMKPLTHMYNKMAAIPEHPRQVFVLTDGGVSNTQAVIKLVQQHANHTRLFSFGIGSGVSTSLVKGIARAGKGKAEFVLDTERLQPKVVSILTLAVQPKVTDVSVQWKSSRNVTMVPDELPPVFTGEHLAIYGIANSNFEKGEKLCVTLSGRLDNQVIEENLEYVNNDFDDRDLLFHRLAAKRQIKRLEDKDPEDDTVKAQIVVLSLAANIISKCTAFVGVDSATKERICEVRLIPASCEHNQSLPLPLQASLPQNYRSDIFANVSRSPNIDVLIERSECLSASAIQYQEAKSFYKTQRSFSFGIMDRLSAVLSTVTGMFTSKQKEPSEVIVQAPPGSQKTAEPAEAKTCEKGTLQQIISSQEYDGCWNLDQSLASLLHLKFATLKRNCPAENDKLWATALVLAWLEMHCTDKKDEWTMIASKAETWLKHNQKDTEDNLIESARCYLRLDSL